MMRDGTSASFGVLKQINAGLLNVGYAEAGKSDGTVVMLLHGWPYDIYSFVDVAPLLAQAGYRVIVPYLRGYGTTRFLSSTTPRNGQQAVLAVDIIAFMDALKISRAILGGFDWGARMADIIAALWPERCPLRGLGTATAAFRRALRGFPLPALVGERGRWARSMPVVLHLRRNSVLVGRSPTIALTGWLIYTRERNTHVSDNSYQCRPSCQRGAGRRGIRADQPI